MFKMNPAKQITRVSKPRFVSCIMDPLFSDYSREASDTASTGKSYDDFGPWIRHFPFVVDPFACDAVCVILGSVVPFFIP